MFRKDFNHYVHGPLRRKYLFPKEWLEIAAKITFDFEGKGFGSVAGNYDKQGLSVGGLQWNYGQGSLQAKILWPYIVKHGASELDSFFPVPVSQSASMSAKEGVKFSLKMQTKKLGLTGFNYTVRPEWLSSWNNFLTSEKVIEIQKDACDSVASQAYEYCLEYDLMSLRSFCFFFDVVTQNGSMLGIQKPLYDSEKYLHSIMNEADINRDLWLNTGFTEEVAVLWALIIKRAKRNRWRNDVLMRKGTIAHGRGYVHHELFDFRGQLNPVSNDCILTPRVFGLGASTTRVKAMYWDGKNHRSITDWLMREGVDEFEVNDGVLKVPGRFECEVSPGAYLLKASERGFVPLSQDTFEKNYRRIH